MPIRPPSWSSTLRLPKSTFPPRPNPGTQSAYLKKCSDDLYDWQRRERADQKAFVLHDGPPYANGPVHVGHALNKILKDIICRVKVQQGRRVTYVPGWDCHGLPIEIKALEQQRQKHKDIRDGRVLNAVEVRQAARSLAAKTVKEQMKGFREWGVMADWEAAWKTMDKTFELEQLRVFQRMVQKGLIFRRYKPVYWSPSSRTALAEAELEYKDDHISKAAFVKFPLSKVPHGLRIKLPDGSVLSAVIWTTTPWTLPANRAIAVHDDINYSVVKSGTDLLLLASARLSNVFEAASDDQPFEIVLRDIKGSEIVGAEYNNELCGVGADPQPVLHADFVSEVSGSGLVHLAPGHGMDDYELCMKHGIQAVAPVDDLGRFTSNAVQINHGRDRSLEGVAVLDTGTDEILKLLEHNVIAVHNHKHKYPYDWRTKLPVIVRATEQWFADVGHVKDDALQALQAVHFIPESGRSRLQSFVKGRSEWCISRQRAWGVPIPALYRDDGTAILTDASVGHIISVIQDRGIEAWWTNDEHDPAWIAPGLEGPLRRGKDTMDVWFDSGSSWTQTDEQADVYIEGTDQHRGWFQSSLLTHTAASDRDTAPFKTLITHGFTLDEAGKKMSKSIGNVIAPQQIMVGSLLPPVKAKKKSGGLISQALGPDALRLWVAGSDYTSDVAVGQSTLQSNHTALLKYRVILKMLLGSMHPSARTAPLTKLDMIALTQLQQVTKEVTDAFDNFEFYKGVSAINRWINSDLSAFYLEAAKDRLYCGDGGGVIEEVFLGLLRMLTPINPLLVEEAWNHLPEWLKVEEPTHPFHQTLDDPFISTERLPRGRDFLDDLVWLQKAHVAIKVAQEIARRKKLIGLSLECDVVLEVPTQDRELFDWYADELETIWVVSSVSSTEPGLIPEAEWTECTEFDTLNGKAKAWVLPAKDHKCPRCWRFIAPAEDELCKRCDEHEAVRSVR